MELHELIIKAHARAHAAELAAHANRQDAAWNELAQLHKMLTEEGQFTLYQARGTPPAEGSES
ncbi:hypothetical protein ES703_40006 [subsurface metagenome]